MPRWSGPPPASGAVGSIGWPAPSAVSCPTLAFTSGINVNGLGTWDGGTKISLKLTTNFIATYAYPAMTFLYSNQYGVAIGGVTARRPNMAVDDDGFAYGWHIATGTGGFWALFKYDIAAHTATKIYQSSDNSNSNFQGPAWNPYDGLLYEIEEAGTDYELVTYTTSGTRTVIDTFSRTFGEYRSDMAVFTEDGAIWFFLEDAAGSGNAEVVRYDGSTTLGVAIADGSGSPVPRTSSTLWLGDDNVTGGAILNADGTTSTLDCSLFAAAGTGTARVHCGLNGLITFIYPTSFGIGTAIYAHQA